MTDWQSSVWLTALLIHKDFSTGANNRPNMEKHVLRQEINFNTSKSDYSSNTQEARGITVIC